MIEVQPSEIDGNSDSFRIRKDVEKASVDELLKYDIVQGSSVPWAVDVQYYSIPLAITGTDESISIIVPREVMLRIKDEQKVGMAVLCDRTKAQDASRDVHPVWYGDDKDELEKNNPAITQEVEKIIRNSLFFGESQVGVFEQLFFDLGGALMCYIVPVFRKSNRDLLGFESLPPTQTFEIDTTQITNPKEKEEKSGWVRVIPDEVNQSSYKVEKYKNYFPNKISASIDWKPNPLPAGWHGYVVQVREPNMYDRIYGSYSDGENLIYKNSYDLNNLQHELLKYGYVGAKALTLISSDQRDYEDPIDSVTGKKRDDQKSAWTSWQNYAAGTGFGKAFTWFLSRLVGEGAKLQFDDLGAKVNMKDFREDRIEYKGNIYELKGVPSSRLFARATTGMNTTIHEFELSQYFLTAIPAFAAKVFGVINEIFKYSPNLEKAFQGNSGISIWPTIPDQTRNKEFEKDLNALQEGVITIPEMRRKWYPMLGTLSVENQMKLEDLVLDDSSKKEPENDNGGRRYVA